MDHQGVSSVQAYLAVAEGIKIVLYILLYDFTMFLGHAGVQQEVVLGHSVTGRESVGVPHGRR